MWWHTKKTHLNLCKCSSTLQLVCHGLFPRLFEQRALHQHQSCTKGRRRRRRNGKRKSRGAQLNWANIIGLLRISSRIYVGCTTTRSHCMGKWQFPKLLEQQPCPRAPPITTLTLPSYTLVQSRFSLISWIT